MTPCHNCHGDRDTPPSRSVLLFLGESPTAESGGGLPDFPTALAPTVACPAERAWPEGLRDSDPRHQAMPWWVRDNFEAARRTLHPQASPVRISGTTGDFALTLGLREFSVEYHRDVWPVVRWFLGRNFDQYPVQGAGNIHSHWTVQDNQVLVPWSGLVYFQGLGINGPLWVNDHPKLFAVDSSGDACLWTEPNFFASRPNPNEPLPLVENTYHVGWDINPRVGSGELNLGLSFDTGSRFPRYCMSVPREFRVGEMSDAPVPASFELEDLLGRIFTWMGNHPRNNANGNARSSDSFLNHLYLQGSPQPIENVFELLRPGGSEITLDLQNLEDLYIPGLLDLGPSQGRLRIRWTEAGLLQATVENLQVHLDARALGPLRLESADLSSLPETTALEVTYDPIHRRVTDFSANLRISARLQWPLSGGREIQVDGDLRLRRNASGAIDFALADPQLHLLSTSPAENALLPRLGESRIEAGLDIVDLYGIPLAPGLTGSVDLANRQVHLQGNLHLSTELPGGEAGQRRLRSDLQFYTTLGFGNTVGPVPGSTSLRLENLYLENPLSGVDALRDGSLLLSDDPGIFLSDSLQSTHRLEWGLDPLGSEPRAYLQARATLGDLFQVDAEGLVPLTRSASASPGYDFSRLLMDQAAELSLNWTELQPQGPGWGPQGRHVSLVDGVLRIQRFPEDGGPDLWEIRMNAADAYFGQGRLALELRNLVAGLEIDRFTDEEGDLHFRLPGLEIQANQGSTPDRGILRGPIDLHLNGSRQGGLELQLDSNHRPTEIDNLDLQFNLQGLNVFPPRARRGLPARTRYLGLDGHLEGNFAMEYPEDPAHWHGRGELRLRGDSGGDIYLLDRHFRRVGPPLLRQTRWRWDRIEGFNWRRGYALGDFHLQTVLNPTVLFGTTVPAEQGLRVYGGDGQVLHPGELWAEMPYDNQPWSPAGFRNRIVDYLVTLCRQDPRCSL